MDSIHDLKSSNSVAMIKQVVLPPKNLLKRIIYHPSERLKTISFPSIVDLKPSFATLIIRALGLMMTVNAKQLGD